MYLLYSLGLFIHIVGITITSGGSIGGYLLERQIWKHIPESPLKSKSLTCLLSKYSMIIHTGTLLMIISGIMMLAALGWVAVGQQWFVIKMVFVIGLSLSGFFIGGPNSMRLHKLIIRQMNAEEVSIELNKVKRNMILFRISEALMVLTIYLLAIFRNSI